MIVSIIIPTYKRDAELKRALISVAEQTYKALEVIVIDDNADAIMNSIVKKNIEEVRNSFPDLDLKLIVNEQNMGSAKTRNIGIMAAKGEYISFLDDDDIYLPEKIEKQLNSMIDENADFSVTDLELYNENGKLSEKRERNYIKKTDKNSLLEYHLKYHISGTDSLMFKKEYLEKIGGFDEIDIGDEYYLVFKAINEGGSLSYLNRCDIKAFVHKNGGGLSSGETKIEGEKALYQFKKQYFGSLCRKERRYIKMRHHAVVGLAYFKNGKYFAFFKEAVVAVFTSPLGCISLLKNLRKEKIYEGFISLRLF